MKNYPEGKEFVHGYFGQHCISSGCALFAKGLNFLHVIWKFLPMTSCYRPCARKHDFVA